MINKGETSVEKTFRKTGKVVGIHLAGYERV